MLTKYFDLTVAVLYAPVYLTLVFIDTVTK